MTIYYDNRKGKELSLSIGKFPIVIKADSYGDFKVPAPTTEAGRRVELNGQAIGKVPTQRQLEGTSQQKMYLFVDCSGDRSYRFREKSVFSWAVSIRRDEIFRQEALRKISI